MNTVYTSCLSSRKTSSKPPELEAEAAPPPLRRPRPPPGRRASRARVSGIPSSDRWSRHVFAEVAADTELLSYGRWDGTCLRATCPCPACCCDLCLVACCMILYSTVSKQTFINTAPSRGHPLHLPLVSVSQYRALLSLQL